tara:strand:+ start:254 stop:520 length:267 start_codon:yes stop_codon:yes gene_type:complete
MKPIEMNENCQFLKDLNTSNDFGGTNRALYNLAVCKGQVKLFSKGIKPNRHWRLKDVKAYFGMNGGTEVLLKKLEKLHEIISEKKEVK